MTIEAKADALLEYLAGDLVSGRFVTGRQAVLKFASFVRADERARCVEWVREAEGNGVADDLAAAVRVAS